MSLVMDDDNLHIYGLYKRSKMSRIGEKGVTPMDKYLTRELKGKLVNTTDKGGVF